MQDPGGKKCQSRKAMLLTVDVGNTNITMGVFDREFLPGMFRMTTKRQRTSDEYGMTICGILEHRGIDPQQIDAVIIASVVPDNHAFPDKRHHRVPAHHAGDVTGDAYTLISRFLHLHLPPGQSSQKFLFNHEEIAPGETKIFTPVTHKQGLFSPDCYNGKSLFTMGEEDEEKED